MLAVEAVRHEPPSIDKASRWKDRGQPVLGGEVDDLPHTRQERADRYDPERAWPLFRDPREGTLDVVRALNFDRSQRQAKLAGFGLQLFSVLGAGKNFLEAGVGRVGV